MATTTFSGPVVSNNGFVGAISATGMLTAPTYAYANLPSASANTGGVIFVSDAAPAAALCFSNGTNWIDLLTGTTVTD